jgi:hypothetical protein
LFVAAHAPTRVVRLWLDGDRRAAADLGYVPEPEKIALSEEHYEGAGRYRIERASAKADSMQ